jgi:type II secretory pathway pseudopilin PulG
MAEKIRDKNNNQSPNDLGFTLIEIAIAIFLLATSLTIILSLQSSVISRSINDRSRVQAMLTARRILAGIETGDTEIKDETVVKPVVEYLGNLARQEDLDSLKDMNLELKSEPWTIAQYEDLKIKKITLTISWGTAFDQNLAIYFFVPEEESEEEDA